VAVAFVPWPYAAGGFVAGLAALVWLVRRPSRTGGITETAQVRSLPPPTSRDSSLG